MRRLSQTLMFLFLLSVAGALCAFGITINLPGLPPIDVPNTNEPPPNATSPVPPITVPTEVFSSLFNLSGSALLPPDPCARFNLTAQAPPSNDEVPAPEEGGLLGYCQTLLDMERGDVVFEENNSRLALNDFRVQLDAEPPADDGLLRNGQYVESIDCKQNPHSPLCQLDPCGYENPPQGRLQTSYDLKAVAGAIAEASSGEVSPEGAVPNGQTNLQRTQILEVISDQVQSNLDDAINSLATDITNKEVIVPTGLPETTFVPPPTCSQPSTSNRRSDVLRFTSSKTQFPYLRPALLVTGEHGKSEADSRRGNGLESDNSSPYPPAHLSLAQAQVSATDPKEDPQSGAWSLLKLVSLNLHQYCWPYDRFGGRACTGHPGNGKAPPGEYIGSTKIDYYLYRLNTKSRDYDYFLVRATVSTHPETRTIQNQSCNENFGIKSCYWYATKNSVWFRLDPFSNANIVEYAPQITQLGPSEVTVTVGTKVGAEVSAGIEGGKPAAGVKASFEYSTEFSETWKVQSIENAIKFQQDNSIQFYALFRGPREVPGFNGTFSPIIDSINGVALKRDAIIRIPRAALYGPGAPRSTRFHYSGEGHYAGALIPASGPGQGTYDYPSRGEYAWTDVPLPSLEYPLTPLSIRAGTSATFQVILRNLNRSDWDLEVGEYKGQALNNKNMFVLGNLPSWLTVSATHPFGRDEDGSTFIKYSTYQVTVTVASNAPRGTFNLGMDTLPVGLADQVRTGPVYVQINVQ
jgi:hypothetical protein